MTIMKQITPEEQIQNQLETIESLNRKIESLEAELQKCLDLEGDSDTTRNSKADVFPELNDTEKEILLSRTETKAKEIIRGCLGFRDDQEHSGPWTTLRNAFISDDKLDSLRSDKFFKYGLQILMYITDTLIQVEAEDDPKHRAEDWLIGQLLLENDEDDYKSLLKLNEAFEMITADPKHARIWDLNPEDVNDLRIDLATIATCHRMVLDAHAQWGKPRKAVQ